MEVPPLASSLNNSAGGKMADIQHCGDGEEDGECRYGCRSRGRQIREWVELWYGTIKTKSKQVELVNICL